jgi:hypothetical protein
MEIEGELVIRDAAGNPRIVLSAQEQVSLISLNGAPSDRSEVLLEASDRGVRIRMRRPDASESVVIGTSDGGLGITLFDEGSLPRIALHLAPSLTGALTVRDKAGKVIKSVELP